MFGTNTSALIKTERSFCQGVLRLHLRFISLEDLPFVRTGSQSEEQKRKLKINLPTTFPVTVPNATQSLQLGETVRDGCFTIAYRTKI